MKHIVYYLVIFIIFLSCKNLTDEAIKYNDQIISQQQKIVHLFNQLDSSFADTTTRSYNEYYTQLKNEIQNQQKQIDSLPPFNGSYEFKEQYKQLLNVYFDAVNTDYKKMIDWYNLPDNQFSQAIADSFNNSYQNANKKIEHAVNKFLEFQYNFAKEYNFSLVKN
ncbi:MAG: hypothetical protein N2449_05415 [Bacteroidales bacterium]|nr:hypothetical protein [Bacteroidales bacterium]